MFIITDYDPRFLVGAIAGQSNITTDAKSIDYITDVERSAFLAHFSIPERARHHDLLIVDISQAVFSDSTRATQANSSSTSDLYTLERIEKLAQEIMIITEQRMRIFIVTPRADSISNNGHRFRRFGSNPLLQEISNNILQRLENLLTGRRNIFVIDESVDRENLKSVLTTLIPYPLDYFGKLAKSLSHTILCLQAKPIKVIAVDLDNTIWGGELGELGFEGIELGGLTARGRAYIAVQSILRQLRDHGLLLAVISKNNHEYARKAIQEHSEMVLRYDDFAAIRIGWNSKAEYIKQISEELNLGLDSFILIDDNKREIEEVQSAFPMVSAIEFEGDPFRLIQLLKTSHHFYRDEVTTEDKTRNASYKDNKKRENIISNQQTDSTLSIAELLETQVSQVDCRASHIRCIQLLNKTNQFNAIGKRYTEEQFNEMLDDPVLKSMAFKASDKFGEYGLVCFANYRRFTEERIIITDFVLSCRAIGRGVEEAVLINILKSSSAKEISVSIARLERNFPIREFYLKYNLIDQQLRSIPTEASALLKALVNNSAATT